MYPASPRLYMSIYSYNSKHSAKRNPFLGVHFVAYLLWQTTVTNIHIERTIKRTTKKSHRQLVHPPPAHAHQMNVEHRCFAYETYGQLLVQFKLIFSFIASLSPGQESIRKRIDEMIWDEVREGNSSTFCYNGFSQHIMVCELLPAFWISSYAHVHLVGVWEQVDEIVGLILNMIVWYTAKRGLYTI